MYNKIGLQGRLVSDPRWKRVIQDGEPTEIVEFLLSVERDEPVDAWGFRKADCFKVIVTGTRAEFVADNVRKGMYVVVDGRARTNKVKGAYTTEIHANNIYFGQAPQKTSGEVHEADV